MWINKKRLTLILEHLLYNCFPPWICSVTFGDTFQIIDLLENVYQYFCWMEFHVCKWNYWVLMQTKLRYMPNKNNKYLPIYLHANFVPSAVIGYQFLIICQPITGLGTKFAHAWMFAFFIWYDPKCTYAFKKIVLSAPPLYF